MINKCSKCASKEFVKAGFNSDGKQRYKCKSCGCHFIQLKKIRGESLELKRKAVQLYLEGVGFRSIGQVLGVSHVSIQKWIRALGEQIESLTPLYSGKIALLEMYEMPRYISQSNEQTGYGLLMRIDDTKHSLPQWIAVEKRPKINARKK